MIIVLNACPRDIALAEKNIEWCIRLDCRCQTELLLMVEQGTDCKRLQSAATEYFAKVHVQAYDKYTGLDEWPLAANHAFQSAARHVASALKQPFYWLEPDVTPLRQGWAQAISNEYIKGGQPFMGHIVRSEGMTWMNGAGVYPADIARHSVDAMITRSTPWDVVLWKDIRTKVHPANHLMAHFPRHTGVQLAIKDKSVAKGLVDSGCVVFHGCNDGSLIDLLSGFKPNGHFKRKIVRYFSLGDINAEVNEAEAMWQKDAAYLQENNYKVLPYEKCAKPAPSIVKQTAFPCGIFSLPLSGTECHFNATVVKWNGQMQLVTRRWTRNQRNDWTSMMVAWKLNDDLYPEKPVELRIPGYSGVEQYEDPRCVVSDNRFWVSYCIWRHGRVYRAHQSLSSFDTNWQWQQTLNAPYGGNGYHVGSGSEHEKNWVWFRRNGHWHFVYSFQPHIVVEMLDATNMREYKSELPLVQWRYGAIHGGTPPVLVGNEYVSFFHSSLAWKGRKKRYYCGAYAFSSDPPFKVTRLTWEPILRGSEQDTRILGGPLVVFPCGAIYENGQWLITGGLNDEASFWTRIPHQDLDKLMEPAI